MRVSFAERLWEGEQAWVFCAPAAGPQVSQGKQAEAGLGVQQDAQPGRIEEANPVRFYPYVSLFSESFSPVLA